MSFDSIQKGIATSDFTLLEGLYQLTIAGHTNDWEFERLNKAVYERLLSSYNYNAGSAEPRAEAYQTA
jgi:hypothetical protein